MPSTELLVGICPHDILVDPEKWTAFSSYVARNLHVIGRFEKYFSFDTFAQQFDKMNFVYAHPIHALQLRRDFGFLPIAKYTSKFDEAVVICQKGDSDRGISFLSGKKVACALGSPAHAALMLDLERNQKEISFEAVNRGSYPEIATMIASEQVQFGIILKEVWDDMHLAYPTLSTLYTSYTKELVHVFMLSKKLSLYENDLSKVLLGMNTNSEGQELLSRLNCKGLEKFGLEELSTLETSLRYCKLSF